MTRATAGDHTAPATLTATLEAQARRRPRATFLRTAEGALTYADMRLRSSSMATALAELGVGPGTTVAIMMTNSIDQVVLWFAVARLGALHAPLNPALTGHRLAHALSVAQASVLVIDDDLMNARAEVLAAQAGLAHLIVRTTRPAAPPDFPDGVGDFAELRRPRAPAPPAEVDDLATATLLFTSGTTGVSKACALSHRYLMRQAQIHARRLGLLPDDTLYTPFPLFHIDAATLTTLAALAVGATAALGTRFSASGFWDEVRAFDATVFNFMGATLTILWKRERSPGDRNHRVRLAWGVPMPAWQRDWEDRFGFPLYQLYGLTDGGVPIYDDPLGEQRGGTCGRVIDEYEVRIVGDDGQELAAGEVGEVEIRGREPGLVMNEYHAMPEATTAVFRDGWLATGDRGRFDRDGFFSFEGRSSDSIRRRGENISAHEVEEIVVAHPDVLEAAAVGVPSDLTEDDLKIFVVRRPRGRVSHAELHDHCRRVSPGFMVPRYIEFVDALPRTPTEKVEKVALRDRGNGPSTWDAYDGSPER